MVVGIVLKKQAYSDAIYSATDKLNYILTMQKAMHLYVEDVQKPVIYSLKDRGKLYKGFFDAKILSFTYISTNIYKIEDKICKKNHIQTFYYKLASINPRNPLNKANNMETKLIKKFNNTADKEYKKVISENGKKYLYYAKAIMTSKQSCMRCHSTPDKAPKELIQKYGNQAGFHELPNRVRAIMSIKMPLEKALQKTYGYYYILYATIFIALLIIYILLYKMLKNEDKENQKLEKLNKIDALTKVFNRRAFTQDIVLEIERSIRSNEEFSLIMYDIDFFKIINDKYGHQVGDKVLIQLSEIVTSLMRKIDKIYRVGGEEFIILCQHAAVKDALELARRIRSEVEIYNFDGKTITISLGVCSYRKDLTAEEIYKKVDDALYQAKKNGRNRVEKCSKE
jgi:diguanylate cyclase (GGDEF)-like protein